MEEWSVIMAAIPLMQSIVLTAFKHRWDDRSISNTITSGIREEIMPELTSVPYAVIRDVKETVKNRTKQSQYDIVSFNVTIWDTTPELAATKAALVKGEIEYAPLNLEGAELLWMRVGEPIRGQQDKFYSATIPFECFAGRTVNRNPS